MSTQAKTDLDVQRLVGILKKGSAQLTDGEIIEVEAVKQELAEELGRLTMIARWWGLERIKRYRLMRRELGELETEELMRMAVEIGERRQAAIRARDNVLFGRLDDDDYWDEVPPLDSDEHIVSELLKERGVIV